MKKMICFLFPVLLLSCYRKQFKACSTNISSLQGKAQSSLGQHFEIDKNNSELNRENSELNKSNEQQARQNDSLRAVISSIKKI